MKTKVVSITDKQIELHLNDLNVSQLKDIKRSLYLRYNKARTGGTWWLVQYESGKQLSTKIGKYPTFKTKDILPNLANTITSIESGKYQLSSFDYVTDIIEWHVSREIRRKGSSKERVNNIKSMAKLHLVPAFESVLISDIDSDVIDKLLILPMLERDYSVSYVRALLAMLKTSFSAAKKLKLITINVIADIKLSDFTSEKVKPKGCRLRPDGIKSLITTVSKGQPDIMMLCMLMIMYGTRIGETRKSKWSDISVDFKRWTIPQYNTKTKVELSLPLSEHSIRLLGEYKDWQVSNGIESNYLFPVDTDKTKPMYASMASELVRVLSAGEWSAHDLRKLARTVWADIGIDYLVSESLLNHAKSAMDKAYIHTHIESQKIKAINAHHQWIFDNAMTCRIPISTNIANHT